MIGWTELAGFGAGLVIAFITAPVGISGAVFLLPVQLDVFHVPNPQVTPTNLLYNVVSGPGALLRMRHRLFTKLTAWILFGTLPGVIVGSVLRVFVASDPHVFRLMAAILLLPLGVYILWPKRKPDPERPARQLRTALIVGIALAVGVIGGIYGIGGGSLISPLLVGLGMSVAVVAPAALAGTFVTSIVGVVTFWVLQSFSPETIAPDWLLGIACGLGGLLGGYLGARFGRRLPEMVLRRGLGILAILLAGFYFWEMAF